MKTLVVYAHPRRDSFVSGLRDVVVKTLHDNRAECRVHDLYGDDFNPVLSKWERQQHLAAPEVRTLRDDLLKRYTDDLKWCESLVLVYPTWWSGQPTMVKGWFDRVLVNGVAWTLPEGANRLRPNLGHIKRLTVVTSHGSSKFRNALQGESGKRVALRGVRALCGVRCRTRWIAMYNIDKASPREFDTFTKRLRRRIARIA